VLAPFTSTRGPCNAFEEKSVFVNAFKVFSRQGHSKDSLVSYIGVKD